MLTCTYPSLKIPIIVKLLLKVLLIGLVLDKGQTSSCGIPDDIMNPPMLVKSQYSLVLRSEVEFLSVVGGGEDTMVVFSILVLPKLL